VDARLCISYLTIELRAIPENCAPIGSRIFGVTIARMCPWNRFATPCDEDQFYPAGRMVPVLTELMRLTEAQFQGASEQPGTTTKYAVSTQCCGGIGNSRCWRLSGSCRVA
jgi:epoxyqueuosine reductase QueG